MYSKLHNLIVGFHGCTKDTYDNVLYNHTHLNDSVNTFDWLGHGVYFWEHNYLRAYQFAEESIKRKTKASEKTAVIGAIIDLGNCLSLTDSRHIDLIRNAYSIYETFMKTVGQPMPTNDTGKDLLKRHLDCAVIEQLHTYLKESNAKPFDSVRGVFIEGNAIYPGAAIMEKTHIQLCVRNPNCIKGYFNPLDLNTNHINP